MAFRTNKTPVLQTKSASGSVATFNTALAMPLSSCNIAVNAWQEGSGDPSPVNNRPIHGFSEVNATRAGKNLLKTADLIYAAPIPTTGSSSTKRTFVDNSYCYGLFQNGQYNAQGVSNASVSNNKITFTCNIAGHGVQIPIRNFKAGETYTLSYSYFGSVGNIHPRAIFYDEEGNHISYSQYNTFTIPSNAYWCILSFIGSVNGADYTVTNIQLEAGSTATAYEPYVTPTIYTIQLGQEVYGAEVDVVNGVAHCTHGYEIVNANSLNVSADVYFCDISNMSIGTAMRGICNRLPTTTDFGYGVRFGNGNRRLYFYQLRQHIPEITDLATAKQWFTDNPVEVVYPVDTFDIRLTPTQIETLIGNNTIFCDTGDVDLTYKDLDIAKRGNFREVFKLPS